jgi:hypothetical protein
MIVLFLQKFRSDHRVVEIGGGILEHNVLFNAEKRNTRCSGRSGRLSYALARVL